MTLEEQIYEALRGLVSDRVYPDVAPEEVGLPYIVFQQVGGEAPNFLERALPSARNSRMQIAVWGVDRAQVISLALQVESTLVTSALLNAKTYGAFISQTDVETGRRGALQDFSFWSSR